MSTKGIKDRHSLREVMRVYPQGVAVVTTDPGEPGPRGITVSSFVSLSLTPPLVLVSVVQSAQAHPAIASASAFAVNILAEDQAEVSEHFARPSQSSDQQFEGVSFRRGTTGSPILEGCLAYLDCRLVDRTDHADHTLFIGEVVSSAIAREARPLVFYARHYWRLGDEVYRRS